MGFEDQAVAAVGCRVGVTASGRQELDGPPLGGIDAAALRVYDDLVRLLGDELGVAPSPSAWDLHSRLLRPDDG